MRNFDLIDLLHGVVLLTGLLSFALLAEEEPQHSESPRRIPLIAGLTITAAISETQGDYEPIYQVQSVDHDSYRMLFSADVPQWTGKEDVYVEVARRVLLDDHRNARIMRPRYYQGDPELYRGTTPFFSRVILTDLRKGSAGNFTWRNVDTVFGVPVERDRRGTLVRLDAINIPVLVNGQRVALPALHVGGRLATDDGPFDADVYVLDDPDNPILLRTRSMRVVRIDFPVAELDIGALENALTQEQSVDVYGIYFGYNSATVRKQSARKLREIAGILQRNPDWRLRIDGHTDSIGSEASNTDLSRRRAEAVKAALVHDHGIAADRLNTGGYGESNPKDSNDTAEGRARNRRVELTRL